MTDDCCALTDATFLSRGDSIPEPRTDHDLFLPQILTAWKGSEEGREEEKGVGAREGVRVGGKRRSPRTKTLKADS